MTNTPTPASLSIAIEIVKAWFTNDGESEYPLSDWCVTHDKLAHRFVLALDAAKAEQREADVRTLNDVGRCMCPFTSGYGREDWKPNMKLGADGKHMNYCPFGIAAAIQRAAIRGGKL